MADFSLVPLAAAGRVGADTFGDGDFEAGGEASGEDDADGDLLGSGAGEGLELLQLTVAL